MVERNKSFQIAANVIMILLVAGFLLFQVYNRLFC